MRKLLTFICCLLVTGCAPIKATYYKPLIEDGYYKGPCGAPDNFGATKLNEKLAYFVYVVTEGKNSFSATNVGFNFRVHPGSTLTLTSESVIINGSNYHNELPIGAIQKQEWKTNEKKLVKTEFKYSDQLNGYPETNLPAWTFGLSDIQRWGGFSFEITMPPYSGEELLITLPSMVVDGQVISPGVLKVIKTTERYWAFFCL